MIRAKIKQILQGQSNFHFPGVDVAPACKALAHAAGNYTIWPLANTPEDILFLLQALASRVVPVLIPAAMPKGKIKQLLQRFPCFGLREQNRIHPPSSPCLAPLKIFFALLTSGSTGAPKVLAAAEENLVAGINAIHQAQHLESIKTTGVALPLAYSYALVNQLFWAILHDRRLILTDDVFSPQAMINFFADYRIEMICLVAEQMNSLAAMGFDRGPLTDVSRVNFAGSPFPANHLQTITNLFPNARIFNNYGCTEAMPRLTALDVTDGIEDTTAVGSPIENVEIRIAGDDECGPVEFRAPSSSIGIIDNKGCLTLHPQWIPTSDNGRLHDGTLYIYGRNDQVVKIGGERHSLLEIENAVASLPVDQAMAWLITEGEQQGEIHLILSGPTQIRRSSLGKCFRDLLPRGLWPKHVFWSPQWPTHPNGKTDRTRLQQWAKHGKLRRI